MGNTNTSVTKEAKFSVWPVLVTVSEFYVLLMCNVKCVHLNKVYKYGFCCNAVIEGGPF